MQLLQFFALCGYVLHFVLHARLVSTGKTYNLHWLFVLSLCAHCAVLAFAVYGGNYGLYTAFSTFGFVSALVGIILARNTAVILLWCASLAIIALGFDSSLSNSYRLTSTNAMALVVHAAIAMLAFAFTSLSSVLLLIHRVKRLHVRQLNEKKWHSLPPLEVVEKSVQTTLFFALVFLGMTIASGFVFINDFLGQHLAHKTFFAIVSWVILLRVWIGKLNHSVSWGNQLCYVLTATVLLGLGYFGSRIVLELLLVS